jgi:hypothetical protein
VSRRIIEGLSQVECPCDNGAVSDDNRAHGNLAEPHRFFRKQDRFAHVCLIVGRRNSMNFRGIGMIHHTSIKCA